MIRNSGCNDGAVVIFGDPFTQCKTDARASVQLLMIKPLKDRKYFVCVLLIEPYSVVFEGEFNIPVVIVKLLHPPNLFFRNILVGDVNLGSPFTKLHGIADQI